MAPLTIHSGFSSTLKIYASTELLLSTTRSKRCVDPNTLPIDLPTEDVSDTANTDRLDYIASLLPWLFWKNTRKASATPQEMSCSRVPGEPMKSRLNSRLYIWLTIVFS